MHRFAPGLVLALCALGGTCLAQGFTFDHRDWQLVCDNTRTCRAAGYQSEGDEPPVSVLLTRKAGPGQPVTGQVMLGPSAAAGAIAPVTLQIDGQSLGEVAVQATEQAGTLTPAQVTALLEALLRSSDIAFVGAGQHWELSDAGAAAVLLRMDEVQGRLGTPGALVRRGRTPDDSVLRPLKRPVVHAAALPAPERGDARLVRAIVPHLRPSPEACPDYRQPPEPAKIWRLDAHRVLVSLHCWAAAYNEGYGFWVVNDQMPYHAVLVTTQGTSFEPQASRISAQQRGRGVGDCFSQEQWVWDGARFVHTASGTTGLCRGVTAGGPWDLPTLAADVRPPADRRQTEEKRK